MNAEKPERIFGVNLDTAKTVFHLLIVSGFIYFLYWLFFTPPQNGHFENLGKSRVSKIYSVRTTTNTEGSFILGIGSISGQDYYIFYRLTESGGLVREKINTEYCILYEGHPYPYMVESGSMWYHLVDGDTISRRFSRDDYGSFITIYIPKGTITERTNIDFN